MNEFGRFFANLPAALLPVLITLLFVGGLWLVTNKITPFDDHEEITGKRNWAYLIQRLGIITAQVIALTAVIPFFDVTDPWWSAFWLITENVWVFVALLLARPVIDFYLLRKTKNMDLLRRGNLAIGITEAAFYVSIGILLRGSLTGEAPTLWQAIASTVAFYVLGLLFVLAVYWLQEKLTRYNMRGRLADGNVPAAIELAGLLIAASIVTSVGVAGDFTTWGIGLLWFITTSVVSIIVLFVVRLVANILIFKEFSLREAARQSTATGAALFAAIMVLCSIIVAVTIGSVA